MSTQLDPAIIEFLQNVPTHLFVFFKMHADTNGIEFEPRNGSWNYLKIQNTS